MNNKSIVAVIIGMVVFLLGVAIIQSSSGRKEMRQIVQAEMSSAQQEISGLEAEVAALKEELENVSEGVANAASAKELEEVKGKVGALDEIQTTVQGLAAKTDAVSGEVETLQEKIEESAAIVAAAPVPAPVAPQVAEVSEASAPEPATRKPGETAVLADGAVRVFVSRLQEDSARLSINGVLTSVSVGDSAFAPVGREFCKVQLDGITEDGATLSALCGDDLPEPSGLSAGETAMFADGALRIFVSRVTDTGARLGLNTALTDLALGASTLVTLPDDTCRVSIDAIDRAHAEISAKCGDDVVVSSPTGAGETATLGDGAARVFVASVADKAVRFAVNGLSLSDAAVGQAVPANDGCDVTVEQIADGKAVFGLVCSE